MRKSIVALVALLVVAASIPASGAVCDQVTAAGVPILTVAIGIAFAAAMATWYWWPFVFLSVPTGLLFLVAIPSNDLHPCAEIEGCDTNPVFWPLLCVLMVVVPTVLAALARLTQTADPIGAGAQRG